MSSLRNAKKSTARSYKERSQPADRKHLGLLEKKKDYKLRALDHQRKKKTLKALERKALDRNPDEFYFNMVKTQKREGVHQVREGTEPESSEDQIKLMYSQDQNYINLKRSSELKKIERLKSSLHVLDCDEKPKNKHIIFVDSKKAARQFDAAKYFNTHPSLLGRQYNRPTLDILKRGDFAGIREDEIEGISYKQAQSYSELKKRIEREKELSIISQKLDTKKQLLQDPKRKRKEVAKETKGAPAQYKWVYKRKR